MSNELQKDDFLLPGNLGTVNGREIKQIKKKDGAITITISDVVQKYLDKKNNIEDAEFEIIQPKQLQ